MAGPQVPAPAGITPPALAMIGGGAVAMLGAVGFVVAIVPRIGYEQHAAALDALDAKIQSDPQQLRAQLTGVERERQGLNNDRLAWTTWAGPTAVVGAALVVTGAAFAITGAVVE